MRWLDGAEVAFLRKVWDRPVGEETGLSQVNPLPPSSSLTVPIPEFQL